MSGDPYRLLDLTVKIRPVGFLRSRSLKKTDGEKEKDILPFTLNEMEEVQRNIIGIFINTDFFKIVFFLECFDFPSYMYDFFFCN